MEGASDRTATKHIHVCVGEAVSVGRFADGVFVVRTRSVTEAPEAGQLSFATREDNARVSNGRGRQSVQCVVKRAEPRNR